MLKQPCNQIRLTNVANVRLKVRNKRFEVACYRNKILNWRSGVESNINDVLQIEAIFENVSKGKLAASQDLKKCFHTTDVSTIARFILDKGDLQVSDQEREAALNALNRDVVTLIAERLFNRRTGVRLSTSMVESALESIGFSPVLNMSAKPQALKAINVLLEKFPEEFARILMLLCVSFDPSQKSEVREFLEHIHAMIQSEENGASPSLQDIATPREQKETSYSSITFLCKPQYYREANLFFSKTLNPSGHVVILSSSECVLDPMGVVPKIKGVSQVDQKTEPETVNPLAKTSPVNEGNEGTSKHYRCRVCRGASFEKQQEFRNHCMSPWHTFNLKRVHKSMDAIGEQEFNDFSQDLLRGFLATDAV